MFCMDAHARHVDIMHIHVMQAHVMHADDMYCILYVRINSDMPTVTIGPKLV
jgi:hypothetical protein